MRRSVIGLFAVLVCWMLLGLGATPAAAHPPPLGLRGFSGGFLHPLFVIEHAMALLALGLLMGGQMLWRWLPPTAFAVGLVAGILVMISGAVPRYADESILGIAVIAGLLAAWASPLPVWLGIVLAFGLSIAVALDSPPEVLSVTEANLMLTGTAAGAIAFVVAVSEAVRHVHAGWAKIAVRAAGSWLAAAAILALVLGLVR